MSFSQFNLIQDVMPIKVFVDPSLLDLAPGYLGKRKIEFLNIQNLVKSGDFASIQMIGHKLQGNAALFGLDWIGSKGGELEELAKRSDSTKILEIAEEMIDFLEKVEFSPKNLD